MIKELEDAIAQLEDVIPEEQILQSIPGISQSMLLESSLKLVKLTILKMKQSLLNTLG